MAIHELSYNGRADLILRHTDHHLCGLVSFDYRFANSDHHFGTMIVGGYTYDGAGNRDDSSWLMSYGDLDYGLFGTERPDPVDLKSRYFDLGVLRSTMPDLEVRTVAGSDDGVGFFSLTIPALSPGELVILRGFEFRVPKGRNHHLRSMAVRFNEETNNFDVILRDNSPRDDTFKCDIHYIVVPHYSRSGEDIPLFFSGPFSRRVQFREETSIAFPQSNQGVRMLSGFHFMFHDNDRHIERIAIDLEPYRELRMAFSPTKKNRLVTGTLDFVELSGYRVEAPR